MSIDGPPQRPSEAEFRRQLLADLTTDLDEAEFVSYRCPNCSELCINPVDSILTQARICLDCHACYLATGGTAARMARRCDE